MNIHGHGRAATCVALTLLTLCAAGVPDIFAQRRDGNRAQAPGNLRKRQPPPPAVDDDRASQYIEEGNRHADKGEWAAALKSYEQAITVNPSHLEAHIYIGDAYMSLGKYKEAFAAYKEAIRIAPSNPEAHYSLGAAYNLMAMYGDAFAPFVRAINLDPGYAEAHYGIGYAYLKLENYKEALVYLKRAVKLMDDNPEAHLSLGLAYLGLGQLKPAEEQLKALEGMDALLAKELEKEMRKVNAEAARPEPEAQDSKNTAARRTEVGARPSARETVGEVPQQTASRAVSSRTQKLEGEERVPQRPPAPVAPSEQQPKGSASSRASEFSLWDKIKNSTDPADFDAYLKAYPAGEFAGLARIRLRIFEGRTGKPGASVGGQKPEAAATRPNTTGAVAEVAEVAHTPPATARHGPLIEETQRLLKDAFANKLTYTATAPGADPNVVRVTYEVLIEYELLSFNNCRIEWRDGKDTLSVALSNLDTLGIKVEARNKPNTTFSIPVWTLSIKTVGGTPAIRALKGDGSGSVKNYSDVELQFNDKEKAERLARLLQQAIILCASGS
jgi:tetratricopeptide (TPR) repeat protein